jgi:hypothetical protein
MERARVIRSVRILVPLLVILGLLILAGGDRRVIEDKGAIEKLAANGPRIPRRAIRLNWEEFLDDPERYQDQYVVVSGMNQGSPIITDCYNMGGPPHDGVIGSEWPRLVHSAGEDFIWSYPPFFIENTFDGSFYNSYGLKITIWGFMRKYQGRGFCERKETVYWYIEAVKMRVDETRGMRFVKEKLARWAKDTFVTNLDRRKP